MTREENLDVASEAFKQLFKDDEDEKSAPKVNNNNSYKKGIESLSLIFLIPKSLQPDVVNLWYFKLILFDLIEFIVWNILGLWHWVSQKKENKKTRICGKDSILFNTNMQYKKMTSIT